MHSFTRSVNRFLFSVGPAGASSRPSGMKVFLSKYVGVIIALHCVATGLVLSWDQTQHLAFGYFWSPLATMLVWDAVIKLSRFFPTGDISSRWYAFDNELMAYREVAFMLLWPVNVAVVSCLLWDVTLHEVEPRLRPLWSGFGVMIGEWFSLTSQYQGFYHDLAAISVFSCLAAFVLLLGVLESCLNPRGVS